MVADQAVFGSNSSQASVTSLPGGHPGAATEVDQHVQRATRQFSSSCGKASRRCTIKEYASLRDRDSAHVSWEQTPFQQSQRTPKPSYPTNLSPVAVQPVFKLQDPYTCVRRTGIQMDISASALRFWEELSLAPAHGSKNIKAFCIVPTKGNASDDVETFLSMIKGAYQSCNLGLHDLGAGLPEYVDGLVHVPVGEDDVVHDLASACKILGTRLAQLRLQGANFVIYMIDISNTNRNLPALCKAFLELFEAYHVASREEQLDEPNDMVLHVLPSHLMFSTEALPMPSPTDFRRLAFDVYDKCSPDQRLFEKAQHRHLSAPAVCLAKPIPKAIDLKLTAEVSAPPLQSDNCIHIAYTWAPGDHWLTASWTDNHGILFWNACYCLGEGEDMPWESFADIAKEIWDTTLEMMHPRDCSWRLFICKDNSIDRKELEGKHQALSPHGS